MMRRFCAAAVIATLASAAANASDQLLLIDAINEFRGTVQRCNDSVAEPLPPLVADGRLQLSPDVAEDLQSQVSARGYPMRSVQAITLSGPRDAASAMQALRDSFCHVLMDPQFLDVGVSRLDREWRVVLARPLLTGRLGDWQAEGQKLLERINTARSQSQYCGEQALEPAAPVTWNAALASAAHEHSRAMANGNFFGHRDKQGRTPSDRAELAGYAGGQIGETIAAAHDGAQQVVAGWLASPGHCATLMNPQLSEFGGAYASDPQSDAGIYWTGVFGGR